MTECIPAYVLHAQYLSRQVYCSVLKSRRDPCIQVQRMIVEELITAKGVQHERQDPLGSSWAVRAAGALAPVLLWLSSLPILDPLPCERLTRSWDGVIKVIDEAQGWVKDEEGKWCFGSSVKTASSASHIIAMDRKAETLDTKIVAHGSDDDSESSDET